MVFIDVVFDGKVDLVGVWVKCLYSCEGFQYMFDCGCVILVFIGVFVDVKLLLYFDVFVDVCMCKCIQFERQIGLVFLIIGVGFNFMVGVNVDVVIEMVWGELFGVVLYVGIIQLLVGEL